MSSTKTISFRLPMEEYVQYLQKAIAKNLSASEYALLKIYADDKNNEELEELKTSYKQLEDEYNKYKQQAIQTLDSEMQTIKNTLNAKHETELKTKDSKYNNLAIQLENLTKQLQKVTSEKTELTAQLQTANSETVELHKRVQRGEETTKQLQTAIKETEKLHQQKIVQIKELQNILETAKQDNRQLTVSVKERMRKAEQDCNNEIEKLKATVNDKIKKTLPEIAKDTSIFTNITTFTNKWEKVLLVK